MTPVNQFSLPMWVRSASACIALISVGACSALSPTSTPAPALYSLNDNSATNPIPINTTASSTKRTLLVSPPHAASGFDSQRIVYVRTAHQLEYFSNSEWIDPPARMLGPLLVAAIEKTAAFRAVVMTPGAANGQLRLDTEIVRLQHEFQKRPSRVRFTLRATLVDEKTRTVIALKEFDMTADSTREDAYGGVVAANQAVQSALVNLSQFLKEGEK
jgi:cholesterol transport system auxiliary component